MSKKEISIKINEDDITTDPICNEDGTLILNIPVNDIQRKKIERLDKAHIDMINGKKITIKNDEEYGLFLDTVLAEFNLFENDFETSKLNISNGSVKIKELWMEVSKENLLDFAGLKEFIENNTNIEVGSFNLTLK